MTNKLSEQNKKTEIKYLGLIDYKEAWDFQEQLFSEVVQSKIENRSKEHPLPTRNYLIFCQHPHVYTLGKSGKPEHLLVNEVELKSKQAHYYKINRGGDITYHGPGQLVVYPIIDLDNFFTDIHQYLRYLEEAVIRTLNDYGIDGGRIKGLTGVWLEPEMESKTRKIAAFGVKSSRWVTMHGLAFNIQVDLDYFNQIIPCGIQDKAVTSLDKELGYSPDFEDVEQKLKNHLVELFGMEIIHEERH